MAIIIKSSNIFGQNSEKMNDNFIESIEVGSIKAAPETLTNSAFFSNSYLSEDLDTPESENAPPPGERLKVGVEEGADTGDVKYGFGFVNTIVERKLIRLGIDIVEKNKYIIPEQDFKIDYSLVGTISKGKLNMRVDFIEETCRYTPTPTETETTTFQIPSEQVVVKVPVGYDEDGNEIFINGVESKYLRVGKSTSATSKLIRFELLVPQYYRVETASGEYGQDIYDGEYTDYSADEINITIGGTVISLDISNNTAVVKRDEIISAIPKSIKIDSNELIQVDNGVGSPDGSAISAFYNNVLDRYLYGLETMVLKCGISNYYSTKSDTDYSQGKLAISPYLNRFSSGVIYKKAFTLADTESDDIGSVLDGEDVLASTADEESVEIVENIPMTFNIRDIVLPMKLTYDKETNTFIDKPKSFDENGNPKLFMVVGMNFDYKGSTTQELQLVEYRTQ